MRTKEMMVLEHETYWTDPDGTQHRKKHFRQQQIRLQDESPLPIKLLDRMNEAVESIRSKLGY